MNKAIYQKDQAAHDFAVDQLKQMYPYLLTVAEAGSSTRAASENIKNELASAFPDIHFSIKTPFFAKDISLVIRWSGKPTNRQIKEIAEKYDARTASESWKSLFGAVSYISYEREIPHIYEQMSLVAIDIKEIKTKGIRKVASKDGCEIFKDASGTLYLKTKVIYRLDLDEDQKITDPKEILKCLTVSTRSHDVTNEIGMFFITFSALAGLIMVILTLFFPNNGGFP